MISDLYYNIKLRPAIDQQSLMNAIRKATCLTNCIHYQNEESSHTVRGIAGHSITASIMTKYRIEQNVRRYKRISSPCFVSGNSCFFTYEFRKQTFVGKMKTNTKLSIMYGQRECFAI